jgi:hypothetical protein
MSCQTQCIATVLAQLASPLLDAIQGLCNTAITALNALNIKKQGQQASLAISIAPLSAASTVVNSLVGNLRQQTQIIPTDLVALCPQLGQINTSLESAISGPVEAIENVLFELNRQQSAQTTLSFEISQIQTAINFFQDVIQCLNEARTLQPQ